MSSKTTKKGQLPTERDLWVLSAPDKYTCVVFTGRASYDRDEAKTLDEATRRAQTLICNQQNIWKRGAIVYAVRGNSQTVARTLNVRGEIDWETPNLTI